MSKVIIIIDMQNDFVDGSLGSKEAQAVLPKLIKHLEETVNSKEADLIFTQDTHDKNYLKTLEGQKLPIEHCVKPSAGWQIVSSLQHYTKQAVDIVEKSGFSSFKLSTLVANYDEIEIVGLCTDYCVICTALMLRSFFPKKKICVNASCCAGITPTGHKNALEVMKTCHIDISE